MSAESPELGIEDLVETLGGLDGVRVREREPFARHTPLRVGGPAEVWALVDDVPSLFRALSAARKSGTRWRLHWPLQDWLVRDGGMRGLVVRPGAGFERVSITDTEVVLGAATPFAALSGLGEGFWSPLADWPGTPGGLLHDGCGDWLAGVCSRVQWAIGRRVIDTVLDSGAAPPAIPAKAILVEIGLRPGLRPVREDARTRPHGPGELFHDPPGGWAAAGQLVERSGLAGSRLRTWRMSDTQPGVLVHGGGGTCADAMLLARASRDRIERKRGAALEVRIPIHGEEPMRRKGARG